LLRAGFYSNSIAPNATAVRRKAARKGRAFASQTFKTPSPVRFSGS